MDLADFDEKELVARAREGDCDAFEELVMRDRPLAYLQAWSLTKGDYHDSWDLVQTTYLKAWKAIEKFKGDSAFATWRHTILDRTFKDILRKKIRRGESEKAEYPDKEEKPPTDFPDPKGNPEDELAANAAELERNIRVHAALAKINPKYRLLLKLVDMRCYGSGRAQTGKKKSKYVIVLRYFRLLAACPGITCAIPYEEGLDFDGIKQLYKEIQSRTAYDQKLRHARESFSKALEEEGPQT